MTRPYQSLYIHVPFCHGKCDYCAFFSLPEAPENLQSLYLGKLEQDCRLFCHEAVPLRSIFIGGGTPSALSPDNLRRMLALIRKHFSLESDCEWTSEANPESLTEEKIAIMADGGINRISLGIQSFQPRLRKLIGRRGSLDRLASILQTFGKTGIRNFNFDLIYNIPGQSRTDWQNDLKQALQYAPSHLSAYSLMMENDTPLARKKLPANSDDSFLDFWNDTDSILQNAGLSRYEIANFSRPGRRCRHNDDVWHGLTYLGLGPAATSFDGERRFTQPPDFQQWLQGRPPENDLLPPEKRAAEILAFGMRTIAGWTWRQFQNTTGFDALSLRSREIHRLAECRLITLTEQGMQPTEKGLLYNDDLLEELL